MKIIVHGTQMLIVSNAEFIREAKNSNKGLTHILFSAYTGNRRYIIKVMYDEFTKWFLNDEKIMYAEFVELFL